MPRQQYKNPAERGPSTPWCDSLELWGGIECTHNRVGDHFYSQLRRGGHWERLDDLDRIASLGIRTLRYPLLWEELAPRGLENTDWTWADRRMERLRALDLRPIIGLVHHGSGPRETSLLDECFPEKLGRYARAVAERYPWVQDWTPVNEPLTTARFAGLYGHWYPHRRETTACARALLAQMRGVAAAMKAIREVNPDARLVQTEDLGKATASPRLRYQADFENERRWLAFDLLTGRLDPGGPGWGWLREAGITDSELQELVGEPCPPSLLGINHYVTSNRFLDESVTAHPPERSGGNGRHVYADVEAVRAVGADPSEPKELLRAAWERYRLPIAITEAHLSCTREEQLRWLTEMWESARALRNEGVHVVAVTAWALFGGFDWNSLLTCDAGCYEPGAWDVRSSPPRLTALAGLARDLAVAGESSEPLVRVPGWWRRNVRLLDGLRRHDRVRRAFTPLIATGRATAVVLCPPVLITGATGTLGQALARICFLRGIPFRLVSRAELDITDAEAIAAALGAFQPWAVVNAAGFFRVDEAEQQAARCRRENALGPKLLATACAEQNIAFMTFSSDLVFSGEKSGPWVESDPVKPCNVYGRTKAAAEAAVAATHPGALIIRTSAFFGPWDEHNFAARALGTLHRGEEFAAADDLHVSPTYMPDLIHAALDLLIDRESGIWHLANVGAVTWADFARHLARSTGGDEALVRGCSHTAFGWEAPRPAWSALASERGQLLLPWEGGVDRYVHDRALAAKGRNTSSPGQVVIANGAPG